MRGPLQRTRATAVLPPRTNRDLLDREAQSTVASHQSRCTNEGASFTKRRARLGFRHDRLIKTALVAGAPIALPTGGASPASGPAPRAASRQWGPLFPAARQ